MEKAIQNRNEIANNLSKAAEAAVTDGKLRYKLLSMEQTLMDDKSETSNDSVDRQLIQYSEELVDVVRKNQTAIAGNYVKKIENLIAERHIGVEKTEKKAGKKKSIFAKLQEMAGKKEEEKVHPASKAEIDNKVFQAQNMILSAYEKRTAELDRLKDLVRQAVGLPKESAEYLNLSNQALMVKGRIKNLEVQISSAQKILTSNWEYLSLLEHGEEMKKLANLMVDPAEADVIMDQINADTEAVMDNIDILGETTRKHTNAAHNNVEFMTGNPEFDAMVDAEARSRQAKPETARERTQKSVYTEPGD